jgi:dephospho-CoA kinase
VNRPAVIGLTGSIGMGKSTTSQLFYDEGIPVWSADDAVHRLYGFGGAAVSLIAKVFPDAVREGSVDRAALSDKIAAEPEALSQIEAIVHPLVAADRADFIAKADAGVILVDVPLLFETGAASDVDYIVVVSTLEADQRKRVLERSGMTEEKLDLILSKQMPDSEKRSRADFVIETTSLEAARLAVQDVLSDIKDRQSNA